MKQRRKRGQALVEFALVTPLMLLMLFGTMHFGYAFLTYNSLQKAVRDGGRFAATRAYGPAENYTAEVANVVVYGTNTPGDGATAQVAGLDTSKVAVAMTKDAKGVPLYVTVGISSYTMGLPLGSITFTNKPAVRFRYYGRWNP